MKKLIAAATFILLAAAANARNMAPENNLITFSPEANEKSLARSLFANTVGSGQNNSAIESTADHSRYNWLKSFKTRHDKNKGIEESEGQPFQSNPNTQQDPQKRNEDINQATNPQEVKSIPKARRVDKPAKLESSAKRPTAGSTARPNQAGKPDRAGNPNVSGKPTRAARPAGAGRPTGAGRPGNGKIKN